MNKLLPALTLLLSNFCLSQSTDCSDLFISEYVEGWSNNKALEIYNPTDAAIDLSAYMVIRYSNGSTSASSGNAVQLTGTVAPGDVHVGVLEKLDENGEGQEAPIWDSLQVKADAFYCPEYNTSNAWYFNGNDALVLAKGSVNDINNAMLVDIFGKIGEDPGDAWTDDATSGFTDANGGAWWTKNHTLVRKASVKSGVTTSPILFNPAAEWDSLSINTWTNLGAHECDCSSGGPSSIEDKSTSFVLYPNPATNNQTINVSANKAIKSFELINALGQKVNLNYTYSNSQAYIHTHNINSGVYSLTILFEDNSIKHSSIVIN